MVVKRRPPQARGKVADARSAQFAAAQLQLRRGRHGYNAPDSSRMPIVAGQKSSGWERGNRVTTPIAKGGRLACEPIPKTETEFGSLLTWSVLISSSEAEFGSSPTWLVPISSSVAILLIGSQARLPSTPLLRWDPDDPALP